MPLPPIFVVQINNKGVLSITNVPLNPPATSDGYRVNEQIQSPQVRLVGADGEMVGVVSRRDALFTAKEAGLDLVEISPNAEPPVCKVLDYGKFKYELQKKKVETKKRQKIIEVKEIQIRPGIEENDYQVKLRNAKRFLGEGDKLKVILRYKGREMSHQEFGLRVLERMQTDLQEISKIEFAPKIEGRRVVMVLGPK